MLRKDPFVSGEYYHIFNRGVDKRSIFTSPIDYRRFTLLLYIANNSHPIRVDHLMNILHYRYEDIFQQDREALVSVGAWCLMPNHFHLLVRQEVEGGVTTFMKKLSTGYSMYFNIKYERTGALFSGRFQSRLVDSDSYLKHLFGYIHLNPIGIKVSDHENPFAMRNAGAHERTLGQYPHSSYLDLKGVNRPERAILDWSSFPEYFSRPVDFSDFVDSYLSFDPGA